MAPKSPQSTDTTSAMLYSLNDDFLRTCSVPSPYQVREKSFLFQYLLFTISPNSNFKDKLKRLIGKYPTIDITDICFPTDREDEP